MRPHGWQVCSELLKRFVVPTLAPSPTIIPQTTEVLSQASKGISLEALGFNNVHRFSNMIVTSPRGTPNLDMYALFNIRSSDNSHI